ncbi:MAG: hypothetical protein LWX23_02595 [Spirochaetia bacterium]|nr:hypothetical protein [Spirochaetia bacterium]MCE1208344.1 hypothetical protein [Spirochaetia bacterium]
MRLLKNRRKAWGNPRRLAVFLPLFLLTAACSNENLFQMLQLFEKTTLVVELEPGVGGKMIYPDADLDVAYFDISGTGPEGASFSEEGYASSLFTRASLSAGEWTISAVAKNAAGTLVGVSPPLTVKLEKATQTHARLVCKALDGNGFYTISISWPGGMISTPNPVAEFVSQTGERHTVAFSSDYSQVEAIGLRQLAKGYYSLDVRLSDLSFSTEALWRDTEEIYIAEGLTTKCDFPLAEADLALKPGARTFAGGGNGYVDGEGIGASFNSSGDVVLGKDGNLYVADTGNNRIRKITPEGVVSTFAGGGGSGTRQAGFIDGLRTAAAFNEPSAIAVESNGNLLVADSGNHAIRRVTTSGEVQTLVGNGTEGDAEGTINTSGLNGTARLRYPCGIVSAGTYIYIADSNNNKIRRVYESQGTVTTYAGSGTASWADGTGTSASFRFPSGIITGPGAIYIADTMNHRIRKINTANVNVSTLAGGASSGSADGLGPAASFTSPRALALSASGYIYVADSGNNKIRSITPEGQVTTIAGSGTAGYQDGPALDSSFSNPRGLSSGGPGKLFVADTWNSKIRLVLTR